MIQWLEGTFLRKHFQAFHVQIMAYSRYQHAFAAIARGLTLVRDWQGYGVSQSTFYSVCKKFNVHKDSIPHVRERKESVQDQTQVLVLIDPSLTTCDAHWGNSDMDWGLESIDCWKENHDCIRCRCKYFHLKSSTCTEVNPDGMQFGLADLDQDFFDRECLPTGTFAVIQKCRRSLGVWCGDDD